jgi:NADH-quinone oxidoreductase subunit H
MVFISFIFLLIFVILSVVFFTLIELKFLGYFHVRLGPDKVGFFGYFQSLADFVKLLEKSFRYFVSISFFEYYFSPFLGLFFGFFI